MKKENKRSIDLQLLDKNCNDCIFWDNKCKENAKHKRFNPEDISEYGYCNKDNHIVQYIPDIYEGSECFETKIF